MCGNVTQVERKSEGGKGTGNSRAYSIDQVQRECDEETVAEVMAGHMSPNAALVQSGIRENRNLYVPKSVADFAKRIREKFGENFARKLQRELRELK